MRAAPGERGPVQQGWRQVYFATARGTEIRGDPTQADHFYAFVSDYLVFPRPVPFREGEHYYERQLRRDDGRTSKGAFGRAVRPLSDQEHEEILAAGLARILGEGKARSPPPARTTRATASRCREPCTGCSIGA